MFSTAGAYLEVSHVIPRLALPPVILDDQLADSGNRRRQFVGGAVEGDRWRLQAREHLSNLAGE
jgi:hypothetical protein